MTKFEYTNVNPYPLGAHAENGRSVSHLSLQKRIAEF